VLPGDPGEGGQLDLVVPVHRSPQSASRADSAATRIRTRSRKSM
jgi:hypothetical protein